MTRARFAVNLDPAGELEDFQSAARTLLGHGLVTERYPHAGALALVRRFEEPLRNEFQRLCHWRLDIGPKSARLLRRPASLSVHRPARTATQSRRSFTPQTYASLCLVLAALEGLGQQVTISQLAEEVVRLRAGDDGMPFDLTLHTHRRAFVDAVSWLQNFGILTLIDGDTEAFLTAGGDALYDVEGDAAGRLLVSAPSLLAGLTTPEAFLKEVYPPTLEGEQARARHRVHRRLLTEPALYYDELPENERDYARQRRSRIRDELERLTGCVLESRLEGQALIGMPAAEPFPASGAVVQAALLLGSELVADAQGQDDIVPNRVGRLVPQHVADSAWRRIVTAYAGRFTSEYRTDTERLRAEAEGLLERLDLIDNAADGTDLLVRPALGRYRAEIRLPETLDV